VLRRDKPVTTKLRGPRARVAHREHSGATGRRREAAGAAGHDEVPAAALFPAVEKTATRTRLSSEAKRKGAQVMHNDVANN
jgi:hypothetical protein